MYAKVTLYKTGFDPANPFVGTSKANREAALDGLPANAKYVIEDAPFNPNDPFRIALNAYQVDRHYDYVQFRYKEESGGSPLQVRHFFIKNVQFVNDGVCRLIVEEDIVGDEWHNIVPKRLVAKQCTYGRSSSDVMGGQFAPLKLPNIMRPIAQGDLLVHTSDSSGRDVIFGAIICTCTRKHEETSNIYYHEDGINYPLRNFFLPFMMVDGQVITTAAFSWNAGSGGGTTGAIASSVVFGNLSAGQGLPDGVTFLSSTVTFDLKDILTGVSLAHNRLVTFTSYSMQAKRSDITLGGAPVLEITQWNNQARELALNYNESWEEYLQIPEARTPYEQIRIQHGANESIVDPLNFTNATLPEKLFTYSLSFVPPYTITVTYSTNPDTRFTQVSSSPIVAINPNSEFFQINEKFVDWYRQNKNSVYTGMEVQQANARENLRIRQNSEIAQAGVNAGVGILNTGIATAANPTASNIAKNYTNALSTLGDAVNTAIAQEADRNILENNQATERAMLELRVADMQNAPSQISLSNSLSTLWRNFSYLRLIVEASSYMDYVYIYHESYGYEFPREMAALTPKHTNFDYYKFAEVDLTTADDFLTVTDLTNLQRHLKNGVRVWYNLATYKTFTANMEVSR